MSKPEQLFCKILENQFTAAVNAVEAAILLPLRGARDVQNNVIRVDNLALDYVDEQILRLESVIIQVLHLNDINQMEGINNFCEIAYSCQILVETLVNNSSVYLPFLDASTVSQLSANYSLFRDNVCILGLRRIVNGFTDNILDEIEDELTELLNYLPTQLRQVELIDRYEDILEDSGIFALLDTLRKFLNCGFGICDYAATANNKLDDYAEKLLIVHNGTDWEVDISSLLTDYDSYKARTDDKINELITACQTRNIQRQHNKEDLMIS